MIGTSSEVIKGITPPKSDLRRHVQNNFAFLRRRFVCTEGYVTARMAMRTLGWHASRCSVQNSQLFVEFRNEMPGGAHFLY